MKVWLLMAGILSAQLVLMRTVGFAYNLISTWMDRITPDELPLSTGEWLQQVVAERLPEADIRLLVGDDRASDSFVPSRRTVILSETTWFKNDPTFWAVGAHELGHAAPHMWLGRLGWGPEILRMISLLGGGAAALILALNMFYGAPILNTVAWGLILTAISAGVLVVIEEGAASVWGIRVIRGDPRVGRRGRRVATFALLAALGTYVAGVGGQAIFVFNFDWVAITVLEYATFEAIPPLHGWRWGLALLLSVGIVRGLSPLLSRAFESPADVERLFTRLRLAMRLQGSNVSEDDLSRTRARAYDRQALVWEMAVIGFVFLAWDQRADPIYVVCMAIGVLAAPGVAAWFFAPFVALALLLAQVLTAPVLLILRVLERAYALGEDSAALRAAIERGAVRAAQDKAALRALRASVLRMPTPVARVLAMSRIGGLAPVLAFWLGGWS